MNHPRSPGQQRVRRRWGHLRLRRIVTLALMLACLVLVGDGALRFVYQAY